MPTAISEFTGEPVDTSSEAWRWECEVRYIVDSIPTREQRLTFLTHIANRRGKAAADALREDVMRLWRLRQGRKA